jgi:hypothetical protein
MLLFRGLEWRGTGLFPLTLSPFIFPLSRGSDSQMAHDLDRAVIPLLVTGQVMGRLGKTCHERGSIAVGGVRVFIRKLLKL